MLTLWLIDDDDAHRASLAAAFAPIPDLVCTGSFADVASALGALPLAAAPDVLLLDVNMPGQTGLAALPALREAMPAMRAVMLTVHDDAEHVFAALERGASGYLVKGTPLDVIERVVREVGAGGMLLTPPVARRVEAFFRSPAAPEYRLTPREREILGLMCEGLSHKMIADRVRLSVATVATHVQHVYDKLHVQSATGAVAKAIRERLV